VPWRVIRRQALVHSIQDDAYLADLWKDPALPERMGTQIPMLLKRSKGPVVNREAFAYGIVCE
jgi:hypothetical protein